MYRRKQVERFNQELDAILQGRLPESQDLAEGDRQALDVARQLAALDLSSQSRVRQRLRQDLVSRVRQSPVGIPGKWSATGLLATPNGPVFSLLRVLPGTLFLVMLALLFGWMFSGLTRLEVTHSPMPATAYVTPGDRLESSPATTNNSTLQSRTIAPRPIPTPLAPPPSAFQAEADLQMTPPQNILGGTPTRAPLVAP